MTTTEQMTPIPDATKTVSLTGPCRQLLVYWRIQLTITEDTGRVGIMLDDGPLVASHVFVREFSGGTVEVGWVFTDIAQGDHTVQGYGKGVSILFSRLSVIPIYEDFDFSIPVTYNGYK